MTSSTARCDRIIALIDQCLAEHDSTLRPMVGGPPPPTTRHRSRYGHLATSAR